MGRACQRFRRRNRPLWQMTLCGNSGNMIKQTSHLPLDLLSPTTIIVAELDIEQSDRPESTELAWQKSLIFHIGPEAIYM